MSPGQSVLGFLMELADFNTSTWDRLLLWAEGELADLRVKNDSSKLDPEATAAVRGEIRFVKKLIGLPEFVSDKAARDRPEPAEF